MNKEGLDYLNNNFIDATLLSVEDAPGKGMLLKFKLLPEKSENTVILAFYAQLKFNLDDGELHIEPQLWTRILPYPLK